MECAGSWGGTDRSHSSWCVAEGPAIYRPRHPERTALYRVVQEHLDRYLGTYEERFEPRSGSLRSVVVRTAEAFLECGRLRNG